MSDDEKLVIEACMNCKNYILGLCLQLDHWVEDDDWCGGCPWLRASGEFISRIEDGSEWYFLAVEFFSGRCGVQK